MALVKAKQAVKERPINYDNSIAAKIQQRRYQMLVHSFLYYELDASIVSDPQWMDWAQELVSLQRAYPDIASKVIFADAFEGFDGSTGCDLPYNTEQIENIAYRLLRSNNVEGQKAVVKPAPVTKSTIPKTSPKKEVKTVEQKPRKGLFSVSRA